MVSSYITEEDVRSYLSDFGPEDNEIDLDQTFTTDKIQFAMRLAVTTINDSPPRGVAGVTDQLSIPFTNGYLAGIAYHLYEIESSRLARNEYSIKGGGMDVDPVVTRRRNMDDLAKFYRQTFMMEIRSRKTEQQIDSCWGSI